MSMACMENLVSQVQITGRMLKSVIKLWCKCCMDWYCHTLTQPKKSLFAFTRGKNASQAYERDFTHSCVIAVCLILVFIEPVSNSLAIAQFIRDCILHFFNIFAKDCTCKIFIWKMEDLVICIWPHYFNSIFKQF